MTVTKTVTMTLTITMAMIMRQGAAVATVGRQVWLGVGEGVAEAPRRTTTQRTAGEGFPLLDCARTQYFAGFADPGKGVGQVVLDWGTPHPHRPGLSSDRFEMGI